MLHFPLTQPQVAETKDSYYVLSGSQNNPSLSATGMMITGTTQVLSFTLLGAFCEGAGTGTIQFFLTEFGQDVLVGSTLASATTPSMYLAFMYCCLCTDV